MKKSFGNAKAQEFEKKKCISWRIDGSIVVWTLMYKGKLANQIVRLVEIVVKKLNNASKEVSKRSNIFEDAGDNK